MNRREFLQCATLLISGVGATRMGWALSEEQQVYLATAPNFTDREIDYFTPAQRELVAAIAETIIPRTDTPGAIDANVPRYIEIMVEQWLNDDERAIFNTGLSQLQEQTQQELGSPFIQLDAQARTKILEGLEAQASDSPWYDLGNVRRDFISDAPFICQVKELTVWGFFTSEVGGTEVLRSNIVPMRFDGDIPLKPDDSSWSGRGI